ncbi:UDP-Glycosyltransferase/glycogen phosphorylase [Heliocybe sulcata]|uniref:UDP-Glycosyltransferase/glycogen phosphorylase n=1 Tax=Heliocybe sulcata TaxID=5364 RepID=A0A5C3MN03_9AGAM|nr:UDP-Glycosyltransferase/glycogen phosphorylase [Heliocybe sulcata]
MPGHDQDSSGPPTPAERKLQLRRKATRKASAKPSSIYLGLSLRVRDHQVEYAVIVHDGMGSVGSEHDVRAFERGTDGREVMDVILNRAREYSEARGHKIEVFAISGPLDAPFSLPARASSLSASSRTSAQSFLTRIWLELDALPFVAPCRDTQFSLEGEATLAVEKALAWLAPTSKSIVKVGREHDTGEVQVDANGQIHLYDLHEQAALTSPGLWDTFSALASLVKQAGVRVTFFSATPRGGGVALMRHALIRLWRLAGLDVRWYVPQGDASVFDITKRRFHNVLQGVNPPSITLGTEHKETFERWTDWNYERFWRGPESPIRADVVVIDDPQVIGLIPLIRRDSPRTKIIYRSHIEIRSDLVDAGAQPQADVFGYLFGFIKQADLFVSHPIPAFVPSLVPAHMPVVYMPPCTDALDGLNKPIPETALGVYRHVFADLVSASTGQTVDWQRGYILQVARFDPSKGIPDLVEAYRLFREEVEKQGMGKNAPQLILTGHSSIDDPDGTYILHKLQDTLCSEAFKAIKDDVFAVRAPAEDRLLDALMRGADVACQVSTREGFEIKVTEAIHKTRWVVATQAGGIPLQIRDGVDGALVPPGEPEAIARALVEFYTSGKDGRRTGESRGNEPGRPLGGRWEGGGEGGEGGEGPREELFTVGNAAMWQYLWCRVLGLDSEGCESLPEAHKRRVAALGLDGKEDLKSLQGRKVWDLVSEGKM